MPLIPPLIKGKAAAMTGVPNNPVMPATPAALAALEEVDPAREAAPAD